MDTIPENFDGTHNLLVDENHLGANGEGNWENDHYFKQYSKMRIHSEMLSDKPRCEAYAKAIKQASPFIKDKIVLDVGCGTGILSCLCAKIGAKKGATQL